MSSRDVDRNLELARQVFAPSAEQRERVLAQLAARAALGSPAVRSAGAAPPTAPIRATRWLGRRGLGLVRAGLFVGAGFALGYWFAEARAPQQPAALVPPLVRDVPLAEGLGAASGLASPPNTIVAAADGSGAPLAPAAPNEPIASSNTPLTRVPTGQQRAHATRPARPPASEEPGAGAERFAEELVLLQRAERAIRSGNGPLARSFIADLEARFPRTALRQERAAVLVLAACVAREPDAAGAARDFVSRNPNSVYLDRIRGACELEPSSGSAHGAPVGTARGIPSSPPPDGSPSLGH